MSGIHNDEVLIGPGSGLEERRRDPTKINGISSDDKSNRDGPAFNRERLKLLLLIVFEDVEIRACQAGYGAVIFSGGNGDIGCHQSAVGLEFFDFVFWRSLTFSACSAIPRIRIRCAPRGLLTSTLSLSGWACAALAPSTTTPSTTAAASATLRQEDARNYNGDQERDDGSG